jgi:hypothetical protein
MCTHWGEETLLSGSAHADCQETAHNKRLAQPQAKKRLDWKPSEEKELNFR